MQTATFLFLKSGLSQTRTRKQAKFSGRSPQLVADKPILFITIFYLLPVQSTINKGIYTNLVAGGR